MWKSKLDYIATVHSADNIIIGDSRAVAAFVPEIIGNNYYNLAVGGGSPVDGYYIFKRYLEQKPVDTVIISYAPGHLETVGTFYARPVKYDVLSLNEINEVFTASFESNENIDINCGDKDYYSGKNRTYRNRIAYYNKYIKALLIRYKLFCYYIPEIQKCFLESRYQKNKQVYSEILARKGNFDFGTLPLGGGDNDEAKKLLSFTPSKITDIYLNKIIALAQKNNVKVFFIAAPFTEESHKKVTETNKNYSHDYNDYIESFKLKYATVLWDADIRNYENIYFGDNSHLNSKGQIKFSKYVKEMVSHQ